MKLILFIISFLGYIVFSFGQQLPNYALDNANWLLNNPASFSEDYLFNARTNSVGLTGRYQWDKLENPPSTIGLQYQRILESLHLGLGTTLVKDQTGAIGTTGFYGTFSYMLPLAHKRGKPNQFLSFGLNAGLLQYRVDFSQITFNEPSSLNLPTNRSIQTYPDFGLGLFYYLDNRFYLGAAIPKVFGLSTTSIDSEADFSIEQVPHYYVNMGGFIPMHKFYLAPSISFRQVRDLPPSLAVHLKLNYNNVFWIGGGYQLSNAFKLETGFLLGQKFKPQDFFRIGMSYTYNANDFGNQLGAIFELNLTYSWGKSKQLICPFD